VKHYKKFKIAHELGHALGLAHEHCRSDRDAYVDILWANIIDNPDIKRQFEILSTESYNDYDFPSIMHYPSTAASRDPNTLKTIIPKPPYQDQEQFMGQRLFMTSRDAAGMAARYGVAGTRTNLHFAFKDFVIVNLRWVSTHSKVEDWEVPKPVMDSSRPISYWQWIGLLPDELGEPELDPRIMNEIASKDLIDRIVAVWHSERRHSFGPQWRDIRVTSDGKSVRWIGAAPEDYVIVTIHFAIELRPGVRLESRPELVLPGSK
jgi:hypothetical protein